MKIDKGFEFFYSKLSYRRKFIRTLWLTPIAVFAIILTIMNDMSLIYTVLVSSIIVATSCHQLIYTYKKSKQEKKNKIIM